MSDYPEPMVTISLKEYKTLTEHTESELVSDHTLLNKGFEVCLLSLVHGPVRNDWLTEQNEARFREVTGKMGRIR